MTRAGRAGSAFPRTGCAVLESGVATRGHVRRAALIRCRCRPGRNGADGGRRSVRELRELMETVTTMSPTKEATAARRARSIRPLRRALRARGADPGARRAGRGVARAARRPAFRGELDDLLPRLRRAADAALARARGSPRSAATAIWLKREDLATPARTRSTTRSGRCCSRSGWARRASSPRPAPASTAWPPRRRARCFGLDVRGLHGRGGHRAARRRTSSA